MYGETLKDEALCFFGELQTKRPNTVKSKIAEFVKKEDQFRKCVLFKIMRERGGEGPRGRSPPSNFKLEDITFGGFIDEKNFSFHCKICGTTLTGRNESEKHLRSDHFKSYKSLFAKECLLQTQDHPRYKEWEDQETLIGGLTFTKHVWKKTNMLVYLHLGAFFHTCLGFNTYMRKKAHMCGKIHTTIC